MNSEQQEELRVLYETSQAAKDRFHALMRRAISGEPISREELISAAEEYQREEREFFQFSQQFVRTGPRMND